MTRADGTAISWRVLQRRTLSPRPWCRRQVGHQQHSFRIRCLQRFPRLYDHAGDSQGDKRVVFKRQHGSFDISRLFASRGAARNVEKELGDEHRMYGRSSSDWRCRQNARADVAHGDGSISVTCAARLRAAQDMTNLPSHINHMAARCARAAVLSSSAGTGWNAEHDSDTALLTTLRWRGLMRAGAANRNVLWRHPPPSYGEK